MHSSRNKQLSAGGFTLVETLVAITILLLVVIGPMTIAQKGMQMGFYANEQMTAVFLAQEAIEAIEKMRDDNALYSLYTTGTQDTWEWYSNLDGSCKDDNNYCDINIREGTFHRCTNSTCRLELNPEPGIVYGYGGSSPVSSIYTRKINLMPVTGQNAALVTVVVSWNSGLFTPERTVTLQSYVYDHYAHYE